MKEETKEQNPCVGCLYYYYGCSTANSKKLCVDFNILSDEQIKRKQKERRQSMTT